MKKLFAISSLVALVIVIIWLLFPLSSPRTAEPKVPDVSNMKQLVLGALMYSIDCDDRAPLAANWTDVTEKYAKVVGSLGCVYLPKDAPKGSYGHVMERSISGVRLTDLESPEETAMIFDGVKLERNATDSLLGIDLARPRGHKPTIAFASGHVKAYRFKGISD